MRALLSVSDKTGLADLARGLVDAGFDLISSGGTARALAEAGVPVAEVADVTGFPEMPGGLVKTLHPRVHGGILADTDDDDQVAYLEEQGIEPIDLVVVNLYPFSSDPSVPLIDIGGPTMVRAAAKNHARVGVVVDPADYDSVLDELRGGGGNLTAETRRRLARKAFAHTAAYDAAIVSWLDDSDEATEAEARILPATLHLALERVQDLRYGENPHQVGARYRAVGTTSWWDGVIQHAGLALSYLNLYDADAAWALVHDLGDEPAVAIIKHANPCGVAVAPDLASAYQRAYECDERSAFGGIVALNRPVDDDTVEAMVAAAQADVVIAPGYAGGVIERLQAKRKNTRILEAGAPEGEARQLRQINGGFLVQDAHHFAAVRDDWQVVTKVSPTDGEWRDAELAWRLCGHVKSNAIVLVKNRQAVGIGAGQQNRVESGLIAAAKANGRAAGGACASDAFYPFPDGIEAAADAGVAVIVQPGGAMNDEKNIARADELNVAMVFTGERHFLH
ncbi:MAG TPA: bifunctional phosphoribosylaminoimidazolecarboxamide formyltransferase/IMP cyclohydrolase [Acidimicrobiales bacterium]|nr:bifunctional phosphoribosylaminoimidazolecarboxamide formyltransferase/IMP cyclohydrolase [Acidimicrobiales bacterium]